MHTTITAKTIDDQVLDFIFAGYESPKELYENEDRVDMLRMMFAIPRPIEWYYLNEAGYVQPYDATRPPFLGRNGKRVILFRKKSSG